MSPVGAARVSRNSLVNVIPDSVKHRYPDATGVDAEGSADLTISGASTVTGSEYTQNEALDYDGTVDNATATLPSAYDPISLFAYAKPSVDGANQNDFAKVIATTVDGSARAYIQVSSNGNWQFGVYDGSTRTQFESSVSVTAGTLYGLYLTYDGTLTGYVNGTQEGTDTGPHDPSADLVVGGVPAVGGQEFAGVVDEPGVANAVLSQSDIDSLDSKHPR